MDIWEKFLTSGWGKEFVAGGIGGTSGVVSGYPLDTLRILQQQQHTGKGSAISILRQVLANEGPFALYKGMAAPLASVAFQNAIVFKTYATLSRAFDTNVQAGDPPSYTGVALGGIGAGVIQSVLISPIELVKIRLQLHSNNTQYKTKQSGNHKGPADIARSIIRTEGWRGIYRGFTITVLRDGPSHGVYFCTYEYMREKLHQGCRKTGQESFRTMLTAGGLAGVASWICCYPLDVIKTRIQAQSNSSQPKSMGIGEYFKRSVKDSSILWRGLGTTVARAFIVNGVTFTAYEAALRCLINNNNSRSNT